MKRKSPHQLRAHIVTGFTFALSAIHANGAVILSSTIGTEGVSTDTTSISINGSGNGSAPGDFSVSGSITPTLAFNTSFGFRIDAVAAVNTTVGLNLGAKTADGLIDRDGSGRLGVREGVGNGIELQEGFLIGINATSLDSSLEWQLTGIRFEFLGGGEAWSIVNRDDTSMSLSGTANGMVDISSLGITVQGGASNDEAASVFMSAVGTGSNFRITGFELDVVPEPSSSTLILLGVSVCCLRRKHRES